MLCAVAREIQVPGTPEGVDAQLPAHITSVSNFGDRGCSRRTYKDNNALHTKKRGLVAIALLLLMFFIERRGAHDAVSPERSTESTQ